MKLEFGISLAAMKIVSDRLYLKTTVEHTSHLSLGRLGVSYPASFGGEGVLLAAFGFWCPLWTELTFGPLDLW